MSANDAIQDEVTSLNAIFDEGTLSALDEDARLYSLRLPSLPSITLRIEFPADYPDTPPSVLGTQSVGQDVPKGMGSRAVDVVREVLAKVYQPGRSMYLRPTRRSKRSLGASGTTRGYPTTRSA